MCGVAYQLDPKDDTLAYPSPPSLPYPHTINQIETESYSSPPSISRINPAIFLAIIILAVIFFICGLLHLLVRFLMKRPSFSSISHSNRYPDRLGSHSLQRQLQQLFRLHDSGLEQAIIDALPVFCYKDIMGLKEPFDCAVCLCKFSDQDRLRLLPLCSHAFHVNCIDTWLQTSSTCPLCRASLSSFSLHKDNPILSSFGHSVEQLNVSTAGNGEHELSCCQNVQENLGEKRVLLVKLGEFRSFNEGRDNGERSEGETSRCNLDARRCYSMGSCQYVVGESKLHVALPLVNGSSNGTKVKGDSGDVEGKKINGGRQGESFSVSKIWLWSKKAKFPNSSYTMV